MTVNELAAGIVRSSRRRLRHWLRSAAAVGAPFVVERRWRAAAGNARPPALDGREIVVSIASYPKRYPTLHLTLKCLLTQSVAPSRVVLWVDDPEDLPSSVRDLVHAGLEVRRGRGLGSYNKIVPALEAFPDAVIVTADDDLYYPPDWLDRLVKAWSGSPREIVCHRAHRIDYEAGRPAPYNRWLHDVADPGEDDPIFPTGVGGVLYPPGSLPDRTTDAETFLALCPNADDVWLYFMARQAGSRHRKAPGRLRLVYWLGTQEVALHHRNAAGRANDRYIRRMIDAFGHAGRRATVRA